MTKLTKPQLGPGNRFASLPHLPLSNCFKKSRRSMGMSWCRFVHDLEIRSAASLEVPGIPLAQSSRQFFQLYWASKKSAQNKSKCIKILHSLHSCSQMLQCQFLSPPSECRCSALLLKQSCCALSGARACQKCRLCWASKSSNRPCQVDNHWDALLTCSRIDGIQII